MKSSSGIAGDTSVVLFSQVDNYINGNRRSVLNEDVTYVIFTNN